MSDLISRQDVLDVLRNLAFDHIFQCGEYYGEDERQLTIINARKAIDVIEAMPSAEPEWEKGKCTKINCPIQMNYISNDCDIKTCPYRTERKKGKWTGDCCSCCGVSKYNYIKMVDDECGPFGTWNFCPHCGADMRGENEKA